MEKETENSRKKYNLDFTDFALQNVDEIIAYIAFVNHQPQNAKMVGDEIFETINRIQQNPFQFKECEKTEIRILGIIHASRNPSIIKSLRKV